jgi:hypothetical protein
MSVSLTPVNNIEGESLFDVSNGTWLRLTIAAQPFVEQWNQRHDPLAYSPKELRTIAMTIPVEFGDYAEGWQKALSELADSGGAILS